jgi:hypothetical protein
LNVLPLATIGVGVGGLFMKYTCNCLTYKWQQLSQCLNVFRPLWHGSTAHSSPAVGWDQHLSQCLNIFRSLWHGSTAHSSPAVGWDQHVQARRWHACLLFLFWGKC